jgi:glycosyltransferase involved in cell wall biosynthesis
VIPVHNGEFFVGAAIDSVLAQSCSKAKITQVIVVDNNSTDATWSLLNERNKSSWAHRVTAVQEPRPHAANARNTGARLATAAWLAFLDADDLWLSAKLQRQFEAHAAHPEAELLFTLGEEFHSQELGDDQRSTLPLREEPFPYLTPSTLLLRREVFEKVGDFPDVACGEFIAWFGWARSLGFKEFVVPEVLAQRRIHANNMTRGVGAMAGYPQAAKWLLDRRRQAHVAGNAS